MNLKTKLSEIPAVFRPWMLFFTLATLALVFLAPGPDGKELYRARNEFQLTIFPWMLAAEITISGGLDTFSGVPANPASVEQRAAMLIGLLLSLVVGPTLLMFGWKGWKLTTVPRHWHPPALLLGTVLVVSTMVPSVVLALSQWHSYKTMREAQDAGRERDLMINMLHFVGRDARQFRILPKAMGGGDGTFQGYKVPTGLQGGGQFLCEVSDAADTLITFHAASVSDPGQQIIGRMSASGALRLDLQEAMK